MTAGAAVRSSTTPRRGMTGPHIRSGWSEPASRGRFTRIVVKDWTPPAFGVGPAMPISATTVTTRCCISINTRTRCPAVLYMRRPAGERTSPCQAHRSMPCSTRCARTSVKIVCRRFRGSLRPKRSPSTAIGLQTTAPGTSRKCSTLSHQIPKCGARLSCSLPTMRTTASSIMWCRQHHRDRRRKVSQLLTPPMRFLLAQLMIRAAPTASVCGYP